MRAKYLAGICLALILLAAGCKKEPEPVTKEPAPNTPAVQAVAPAKTTLDEAVQELAPAKTTLDEAVQEPAPAKTTLDEAVQELAPAKTTLDEAVQELAPAKTTLDETEYFAVFMEGKKVGYAIQSRSELGGKVSTSEEVSITINRMGIPVTVRMTETSIETFDGKPVGFEVKQLMGTMEMKTTGRVDPNGLVHVASSAGGVGAGQESTFNWPEDAMMAEGLSLLSKEKGLEEGVEYSAKLFSAGVSQALDVHVRIGGRQEANLLGRIVNLTEVTTTMTIPMAGEIVSTSYVDEDYRVQKTLVPIAGMQIEMIACAKEFALGKNDVFEVINKMFLASPAPLGQADRASSITYTLSPIDNAEFNIPATDSQQVDVGGDGKVTLTVKSASMPVGGTFPYAGEDEGVIEATKANRFLQSDDERVVALARKAVGRTKDAGEAARRIEAFVAKYIENKDFSVGYASALEVVASKQGDCSEHAVLAAAMCRAVGIPAQIVTGVAYVEDWKGLQGFGGHAWVQAYVGGRTGKWVGLDAAFKGVGWGGYGPGHIALAVGNGEPADFFNLATTLGKFKIDEVVIKRR